MGDVELTAAEDARLDEIRSELLHERRVVAASDARCIRLLAEAHDIAEARTRRMSTSNLRSSEMAFRSIALEFGAALRVSDRTVKKHLADAEQLMRLFPGTVDALEAGRISRAHAMVVLNAGVVIADVDERGRSSPSFCSDAKRKLRRAWARMRNASPSS